MHIRQTARIISTYSADVMGVCSALYEFGGMVVMHDPSGCNSTYTTHDEPRWDYKESQIFISALTEMEAIMGDDSKIINDIISAANDLHPAFIAIAGTPIPTMIGFDFHAVAAMIEAETGIPTIGIPSTGMNTYVHGASMAFAALAQKMVKKQDRPSVNPEKIKINVLGLTPLDFSIVGIDSEIINVLNNAGFELIANFGMANDSSDLLNGVKNAALADVNLVVSSTGLETAKLLKEQYDIPYVIGTPVAGTFTKEHINALREAALNKQCINLPAKLKNNQTPKLAIVGESVTSMSIAEALELKYNVGTKVICATDLEDAILREGDVAARFEKEIQEELINMDIIIGDPMFKPICPKDVRFISLPHEAFSGRTYRKEIPNLALDFSIKI